MHAGFSPPPREVAKELVGHRTDAMYSRYTITNMADKRRAVRRLGQVETPPDEPQLGHG